MCPRNTGALVTLIALLACSAASAKETESKSQARPFLGVLVGPAESGEVGVLVREVTPGSPAAKAGLKTGDRISKIEDQEVKDVESFLQTIAARRPGDKLTFHVFRAGQEQNIKVTLGQRSG